MTATISPARIQTERRGHKFTDFHRQFCVWTAFLIIGSCAVEGPLRWVLSMVSLQPLIYLRDVAAMMSIVGFFFTRAYGSKAMIATIGLITALAGSAVYSLLCSTSLGAIGLGIKTFIPVIFGIVMTFHQSSIREKFWIPAVIGLVVTVIGVQISGWVTVPWTKLDYEVFDRVVEGTREWTMEGNSRLAGLTRSSGDAANLIVLLYVVSVFSNRRWATWFLLTPLAGYGLYLTTMRSAFVGLGVALVAAAFIRFTKPGIWLARLTVVGAMLVFLPAPLYMKPLAESFKLDRGGGVASGESMLIRVYEIWPDLMDRFTVKECALGLGIGNVGVAQKIFTPENYNPGDHFGLYLFAVFGISTVLFHLWIGARLLSGKASSQDPAEWLFIGLAAAVYGVGFALNCFESFPLALSIGIMIGLASRTIRRNA